MTKEEIWEMTLPRYLRNDIEAYIKGLSLGRSLRIHKFCPIQLRNI